MKTIKINGRNVGRMTAQAYNLLPKAFRFQFSPAGMPDFKGWVVGNRKSQRVVIQIED